jgi:hypothetical protein
VRAASERVLGEKTEERFALAGNAYRGIGIPDAIKSANDAVSLLYA